MRKFIFFFLLLSQFAFSQQKVLMRFVITDASQNGYEVTESYISSNAYLAFYEENGVYGLANVMATQNRQSYGRIYDMDYQKTDETDEQYLHSTLTFRWRYINTYDTKKGTAVVRLDIIKKPQENIFRCIIIPENLDKFEYRGYIDGSLNLDGIGK